MQKIEIYVTDAEYIELMLKIQKYQKNIMENQEDGQYSDQERAEIINAFGAIPFYANKGLKREIKEIDEYIKKYSFNTDTCKKGNWSQDEAKGPFTQRKVQEKNSFVMSDSIESEHSILDNEKPLDVQDIPIPEDIQYETQTESGGNFDFNL